MNTNINARDYLEKCGIKPSLQRIAIVEYLMENRIHPTADDIYHALCIQVPTLSKTTVYNTMRLFAEQGAVLPLVIDDKNVRSTSILRSCHFQCCACNRVFDIPVEKIGLLNTKQIGDLYVTETHLYYKGYCKLVEIKRQGSNPFKLY